jgi:hypothetical protein
MEALKRLVKEKNNKIRDEYAGANTKCKCCLKKGLRQKLKKKDEKGPFQKFQKE